jgi:hypothetical protein
MTFDLIRFGWPNTAAILALAVMPVVALSSASNGGIEAARIRPVQTAAFCPAERDSLMTLAAATPQTAVE